MAIQKMKIGEKVIFFKITNNDPRFKSGPAVYIEYDSWDKSWSVYRSSISQMHFPKMHWELGNGWNLYKNLTYEKALKAARNALEYLK
jgi:hypothetical protein